MSTELLLKDYMRKLKLPAIARQYRAPARSAAENNRSYEERWVPSKISKNEP